MSNRNAIIRLVGAREDDEQLVEDAPTLFRALYERDATDDDAPLLDLCYAHPDVRAAQALEPAADVAAIEAASETRNYHTGCAHTEAHVDREAEDAARHAWESVLFGGSAPLLGEDNGKRCPLRMVAVWCRAGWGHDPDCDCGEEVSRAECDIARKIPQMLASEPWLTALDIARELGLSGALVEPYMPARYREPIVVSLLLSRGAAVAAWHAAASWARAMAPGSIADAIMAAPDDVDLVAAVRAGLAATMAEHRRDVADGWGGPVPRGVDLRLSVDGTVCLEWRTERHVLSISIGAADEKDDVDARLWRVELRGPRDSERIRDALRAAWAIRSNVTRRERLGGSDEIAICSAANLAIGAGGAWFDAAQGGES